MKALFVSNDPSILTPGSPARIRMQEYAKAIGTLYIVLRASTTSDVTDGNLILHSVVSSKLGSMGALAHRTRSLIASEGIEVVSAQDPFEHGLAALQGTKGTSAKLHIQIHTDFLSPYFARESLKNRIRLLFANQVLPKADGIRVVSRRIQTSLQKRYGSRIVEPTILPIAVGSVVPAKASLPEHAFSFPLVTVGRLEKEKRIEDILEAVSIAKVNHSEIGLVVVGEGRERVALERKVRDLGIIDHVVFTGAADGWALIASGSAYIQASAYEGYGRTLIEAALAGVPIITTNVGVVGEVLVPSEDAQVAEVGDVAQLARHISLLVENESLRRLLAENAERKARAHVAVYSNLADHVARDLSRL